MTKGHVYIKIALTISDMSVPISWNLQRIGDRMKNKLMVKMNMEVFTAIFRIKIIPMSLNPFKQHIKDSVYLGKIRENNFNFFFKEAYISNAFTTVLRGKIVETSKNTIEITWHYSKQMFTTIFMFLIGLAWLIINIYIVSKSEIAMSDLYRLIPLLLIILSLKIRTKATKDILYQKLVDILDSCTIYQ